jgi:multidrug resistance efflux pump
MDIKREKPKSIKKPVLIATGVLAVAVVTVLLGQLRPAAPTVDGGTLYTDSVVRGPLVREVRGPGSLIPEQIRFITAVTAGRVEKRHLRAPAEVTPETVILELVNPDVEIQVLNADRQLADAEAALVSLRTNLRAGHLSQASLVEDVRQQYSDAKRRAEAGAELLKKGLIIPLDQKQAEDRAAALEQRLQHELQRLELLKGTIDEQIRAQEAQVRRLRSIADFQHQLRASMVVRAGTTGILQEVPLEIGQYAQPGALLARVIPTPIELKAVLRIPETQARDLAIGQIAEIDTRNGKVKGHVVRVDPSITNGTITVDVTMDEELPAGARPDLSVDGLIELERLPDVLHVGRPAYAQERSTISLFKLTPDRSEAVRVQVRVGRLSVRDVEILGGLETGDIVILSDMSRYENVERVRIK